MSEAGHDRRLYHLAASHVLSRREGQRRDSVAGSPSVVPKKLLAGAQAAALQLITIAADTDNLPGTLSEFITEITAGTFGDILTAARPRAAKLAAKLTTLAAAYQVPVAGLLAMAQIRNELFDELLPVRAHGVHSGHRARGAAESVGAPEVRRRAQR